ncbi:MAG: ATP--guanido phosphotransferase, partial [Clostridia bacterium]|nr:ATP--guanido phosphotransferase [Clostridia bacterium]
ITPEKNPRIVDRICRAEGILTHAYMLCSEEFLTHYSDVRLGIALGLVTSLNYQALDTLLVEMMPYNLAYNDKAADMSEQTRDLLRAKRVKEALSKK